MAATNGRNFPFLYQGFAGLPCRLENFGSAEYVFGDLNKINLPEHEYDMVVVADSLHHIADIERLVEQVQITLKPGGAFVGMDHAFATARTEHFNLAVLPWLDDFYAWVTLADPQWLYEEVNAVCDLRDWGVLNIDYDTTPAPGFELFLKELLDELLSIARSSMHAELLTKAQIESEAPRHATQVVQESPFEDVSAERLAQVLLDSFHVNRFTTICPFITPELHVPNYRSEKERLFQHYLSVMMINIGERAVVRDDADGQWFLFNLSPPTPAQAQAERIANPFSPTKQSQSPSPSDMPSTHGEQLADMANYIQHLETEIKRKEAAIAELEHRVQRREAELIIARQPRLPWKNKGRG